MSNNSSDALAALFMAGGSIAFIIFWIVYSVVIIAVSVVLIISLWKLFVKAGKPGWASLIPVYNFWVMAEITTNNNIMWFIFIFIPFLNFASYIVMLLGFAKTFGKSTGFGILTIFFNIITLPILAFGKAEYDPALKM